MHMTHIGLVSGLNVHFTQISTLVVQTVLVVDNKLSLLSTSTNHNPHVQPSLYLTIIPPWSSLMFI